MRRPAKARGPIGVPLGRLPSLAKLAVWRQPRLGSGPARRVRLALGRHRRALAVCLALLGLWVTIRSAAPAPPATVAVLVAAHDLPAGYQLASSDLRSQRWPAASVPAGLLPAAAGDLLAAPVRSGEPLTDARVVGPGLLAGQPPGTVAMVVRLGDPMAGALVGAGDRVDVLVAAQTSWDAAPDLADGTGSLPAPSSSRATPPDTGGNAAPPDTGGNAAPPDTGGNAAPPDTGGNAAPPDTGGNAAPPDTGGRAASPDTLGNVAGPDTSSTTSGRRLGASNGSGAEAERVVAGALVLAVPGSGPAAAGEIGGSAGGGGSGGGGGLAGLGAGDVSSGVGGGSAAAGDGADRVIVLAVSPAQARRLALAQTGKFVTIALLQPGSG